MSNIIDKKQMSEEDIKRCYITPAISAQGWADNISMETAVYFTDGKVDLRGNRPVRGQRKRADYILYLNTASNPIAIIEAKDNTHSVSAGLQQAMEYARMLDLPFAYSSNGDAFYEHDFLTGREREIPLAEFPTVVELTERYKRESNGGQGISPTQDSVLAEPYYSGHNTYPPRYYQRIAINRTLDAIARGQERLLLVMATGTGKTYTAFQIVYRLLKSGLKKKILYLADRTNLIEQSKGQDFAPLEKVAHQINFATDNPTTITAYQVYFSLYQQLAGDCPDDDSDGEDASATVERFAKLFRKDFFDLIIVDECHRGSAKEDSNWRRILEYFDSATQLGMTATPKETRYVSNIDYFGEPIYTYSLRQGVEDGFLAPFRVINIQTNISDGWRPYKGQLDKNGVPIEDRIYSNSDFDYNIILEDRTEQVAREITKYLKYTGRMQKTIVFCANEDHAERMRIALCNANADMVRQNPDYVVRITGSDTYGKSKIRQFNSVHDQYPVIATTSKLLSTGSDCKMTKLIVLDEMIGSMIEFKQIIGRGTRLRWDDGKTHFAVMDFRNVTRLFADPDWDGPIEPHPDYPPETTTGDNGADPAPPLPDPAPFGDASTQPRVKPIVGEDGCRVEITGEWVSIYDGSGKLLRRESIVDYTKSNILGKCATLDNFIGMWSAEAKKAAIRDLLLERGIDLEKMKAEHRMADVDDFDFICHVAYDQKPLTRRERADNVKKRDFLSRYSGVARKVLEALLDKFMNVGIYEIENTNILELDPFRKFGKKAKIMSEFGGKEGYIKALKELEKELYTAA